MATYDSTDHAEKGVHSGSDEHHLDRLKTAGGHDNDRSQPALPVVHRSFANPAPLGLLSFATGTYDMADGTSTLTPSRYLPHIHIRCARTRNCNAQRPRRCPHIFRWSLPIHLRHHGILLWQHLRSNGISIIRSLQFVLRNDLHPRHRHSGIVHG